MTPTCRAVRGAKVIAGSGSATQHFRARAVLFDFGGTLYDCRDLERGSRECLRAFVDWHGHEIDDAQLVTAYRQSLRKVFYEYLPRPFYYHRDMFRRAGRAD